MTPVAREQLRLSLLRILDGNHTRFGLRVSLLHSFLVAEGLAATEAEVERELEYLEERGLAARLPREISPEIPHWRITATGRDHEAQRAGR